MKAIKFLWECIGNFLGPSMSAWKGWIGFFEILIAIAICAIVCIFVNLEYAFFITVGIILGICAVICIIEIVVKCIIKRCNKDR